jgi:SAM-dependent methyltransferase
MEYPGRELEVLSNLDNYLDWIVDEMAPFVSGRVLEVGAGVGSVSKRLVPLAESLVLLEPDPGLSAKLDGIGDEVVREPAEEFLPRTPPESFDSIVSVNVLEHIEDDAGAIRGLHRLLSPGGTLCLFVPALPALYSDFDRLVGHYRRYTRASLKSVVERGGFETVRAIYFDAPGVPAWLLMCRLLGRTEFQAGPVEFYDRWIVPATRALESLVRPPIGKNVLLIAKKR